LLPILQVGSEWFMSCYEYLWKDISRSFSQNSPT